MAARFFLVTQGPFTRHLSRRIDADLIETAGFEFIVIDATDLLLPQLREGHGELASGREVWQVSKFSELDSLAATLDEKDIVVFWGAYFDRQISSDVSVYASLSRSNALIGAVNSGTIPSHLPLTHDLTTFLTRSGRKLIDVFTDPKQHWPTLHQRIRGNTLMTARLGMRAGIRKPPRPLDFVWTSTIVEPISSTIIDKKTSIRFIHTLDYEKIQSENILPVQACRGILYVDVMGPLHPDGKLSNRAFTALEIDEYFATLRRTFTRLECVSGRQVTIAAHPRAATGSLDNWYAPFSVAYNQTPRLIASAGAVLDNGASTSIGMAVLARRPISLLKLPSAMRANFRDVKDLSRLLKVPITDVSRNIDDWVIPRVDEGAYRAYEETFLKRRLSSKVPFWEQVLDDIKVYQSARKRTS